MEPMSRSAMLAATETVRSWSLRSIITGPVVGTGLDHVAQHDWLALLVDDDGVEHVLDDHLLGALHAHEDAVLVAALAEVAGPGAGEDGC